jgi:monoamine oxidase
MIDTIIVGAGAAGLMAARELRHAGREILVLESSDRIGGRVLTLHGTNAGVPVELGAEFIHGDAPETTRLLDEARLVTISVDGEQYRSDKGELSPQGDIWKKMRRVFRRMNAERKHDRSFQDFLDEKPGGAKLKAARELARGFVEGFNGADTTRISEKSLADQGDPTEGAAEARRIVNGYSALIEYMQRDVADAMRLSSPVARIVWDKSGVRVFERNGSEHNAKTVIVTVPLPVLQDDSSLVFEPDIPALRSGANQLVMGQVARVSVVLKERFWEKRIEKLSFLHSPKRPFNVWWTQNPICAPLLTGWSGGPRAVELLEGGDIEFAAIDELARVFGIQRRRADAMLDSIHTWDWMNDPHIRGAYSYSGVGGHFASRILARSIDDTLFFAGEATDSGSSGTVEGAIASGKRAAQKVLKRRN